MTNRRTLTEQLDAKLDQVLKHPGGWGGMDALEPLVLMLLILRAEVATPPSSHREVLQHYRTFLARRIAPGHGDIRERLGEELSLELMVELLREHVEAVRERNAPSRRTSSPDMRAQPSSPPRQAFPRFAAIESEAPL